MKLLKGLTFKYKKMEEVIKTTRTELINAFMKWNKEYLENKEDYDEVLESAEFAAAQVDELLAKLKSN